MFIVLTMWSLAARADEDLNAASGDVEVMTSDSDAVRKLAAEAKARAKKEREENAILLKQANEAKIKAAAEKKQAQAELRASEKELRALAKERTRIQKDLETFTQRQADAEKAIADNKDRGEKARAATESLRALIKDKIAEHESLEKQKTEALVENKKLQAEKERSEEDLKLARDDARKSAQELDVVKNVEAKKRAALTQQLADLKKAYQDAKARVDQAGKAAQAQREKTAKLEAQAAVGASEVKRVEKDAPARAINAIENAMTLRIDCRVHDGPLRSSPTLGVQLGGSTIADGREGKGWIGWIRFPYNGQDGYVAKSCF